MKSLCNKELFTLRLSVTDVCNLRCKYCFVKKKASHLSLKNSRTAIDFLSLVRLGFKNVHIDAVHGTEWGEKEADNIKKGIKKITNFLSPFFSPLSEDILGKNHDNKMGIYYYHDSY